MPLYTYHCQKCGETFDKIRKVDERKSAPCDCGSSAEICLSAPRTIVNGYFEKGRAFVR